MLALNLGRAVREMDSGDQLMTGVNGDPAPPMLFFYVPPGGSSWSLRSLRSLRLKTFLVLRAEMDFNRKERRTAQERPPKSKRKWAADLEPAVV